MDILRKTIRKVIHILGGKKILTPKQTMYWLHTVELCRFPNLKSPQDINEKLMWLEHYSDTTDWSVLSDKYQVKEFVKKRGFKSNLIPDFGVFNKADEIDFGSLPNSFVIKSTNGCEQTIVVKDKSKISISKVKNIISQWQKVPFGFSTGETHYSRIKPRIIIQQLLPLKNEQLPVDYKFYCYNGKVETCLIVSERNQTTGKYKLNMMNVETWEEIDGAIKPQYKGQAANFPRPDNLKEMIRMAQKLSEGFQFVRVDLYDILGKIYFGELTFTPASCRAAYLTRPYLIRYGEKIKLTVPS